MSKKQNVTVLGCGRWASFHAWYQATKLGNNVLMWGRANDPMYEDLALTRRNDFWTLPDNVTCGSSLAAAIEFSDYIFVIIAAQGMRELSTKIAEVMATGAHKNKTFILCMKGIDEKSYETMAQILRRELSAVGATADICVWIGPGHIQDFMSGQPGLMIIDGDNAEAATRVATTFSSSIMKLYVGEDLIGAEVGGSAKNVLGIAAGMLDGANMSSLKGALMARGAHEVSRLIVAMGGNALTAYGLSHLGDYEATLFSKNSKNRGFGEALFNYIDNMTRRGVKLPKNVHLQLTMPLAEGVATSVAIVALAKRHGVEMPICSLVHAVLYKGADPRTELEKLFLRSNVKEFIIK